MNKIFVLLLTYLFLFSPALQLLPISILNLMAVGAYAFLISRKQRTNKILYYKRELKILFVILLYTGGIFLVKGMKSIEPMVGTFKLLFLIFPIAIALTILIEKHNKSHFHEYFTKNLIYTFSIAGLISMFLFSNPDINEFVKNNILRTLDLGSFQQAFKVRGFGLSDGLLFAYPVTLGLGICFILEYLQNRFIAISLSLILLISILINARIGLVPVLGYLIYLLFVKRKFIMAFLAMLLALPLYIYINNSGLPDKYAFFSKWIVSGFEDTVALLSGTEVSGNYSVLASMVHFPQNLIFGSGDFIFTDSKIHSDIGFILQLYYGGIIYLFLIFLFFFVLIKKLKKYLSWKNWFPIIFLITVVASNIKGNFFSSNPAMHTLIFLYVFFIYFNKQASKINNNEE